MSPPRHPSHRSGFIEPCLPTRGDRVPDGPLWAHEIKFDGYRFLCRRDGERVRVFSRRGLDWTDRVPGVVAALEQLGARSATIDGEAVVVDGRGVADFLALRSAMARRQATEAFLYAFDLLELIGLDAKSVFQVHGVDAEGRVVVRRQLKRRDVLSFSRSCSRAW